MHDEQDMAGRILLNTFMTRRSLLNDQTTFKTSSTLERMKPQILGVCLGGVRLPWLHEGSTAAHRIEPVMSPRHDEWVIFAADLYDFCSCQPVNLSCARAMASNPCCKETQVPNTMAWCPCYVQSPRLGKKLPRILLNQVSFHLRARYSARE